MGNSVHAKCRFTAAAVVETATEPDSCGDNALIFTLNDLGELSRRFADNIADIFRCLPVCGFEKIERNCSEIGRLEG